MEISKWIIFCIISFSNLHVSAQCNTHNYITSSTFLDETGNRSMDVISYYDGLGRKIQTVYKNVTVSKADLVNCINYDNLGRIYTEWMYLPFSDNNGKFIQSGSWTDHNINEPYTKNVYESSPLNRVMKTWGVGLEWHRGKGKEFNYMANNNSSLLLVTNFKVENGSLVRDGNHGLYELRVEYSNDEDEHEYYIFKDKIGNKVLTRQISDNGFLDTYFVYDEHNNLRFVLPPLAVDALINDGIYEVKDDNVLGKYAYVYSYDSRNRCNYKKLPGCAYIKMVYDVCGNLLLQDDGELRKKKLVQFYRYDKYNRLIMKGLIPFFKSIWTAYTDKIMYETYDGSGLYYGYTNNRGLKIKAENIQEVYYYDNYDFLELFEEKRNFLSYCSKEGYGIRYINKDNPYLSSKGLLTGHLTKVIGEDKELINVLYYNDKEKVIQNRIINYVGGYDCNYYKYDFIGNILRNLHEHYNPVNTGLFSFDELYTYSYDDANRLIECRHQLKNEEERLLYRNSYDEYGRVKEKVYTERCKTKYDYNIRIQLTGINFNDWYKQTYVFTNGGNIRQTDWSCNPADFRHTYVYSYDKLNRLIGAEHKATDEYSSGLDYQIYDGNPLYNVNYEYDKHGNVIHLQRLGYTGEYNIRSYDDLIYQYNGNQLKSIECVENEQYISNFEDAVHDTNECFYDLNGNLVKDNNRNIESIHYNYLNLPQLILYGQQDEGKNISYTYSSDGVKLKACYATGINNILSPIGVSGADVNVDIICSDSTIYCDNCIYVNGKLDRVLLPEGYIQVSYTTRKGHISVSYDYYYYVKDYQGSVRLTIPERTLDGGTPILERGMLSYYPFGGSMKNWVLGLSGLRSSYQYNGKEKEIMHNLGWYDYGKRFYDPNYRLSFISVDPLCEKYYSISPYAYAGNNPVNAIDMKGDSITILNLGNGIGHMAILIQNDAGKWQYFSINGDNVYVSGVFMGGRKSNDIAVGEFDSPQQFMDSDYNSSGDPDDESINSYGYSEGYIIPTSQEQDNAIREEFISISDGEAYDLFGNNCSTAVQRSLEAAGIKTYTQKTVTTRIPANHALGESSYTTKYSTKRSIVPSSSFRSIMEHNPYGSIVTSSKK